MEILHWRTRSAFDWEVQKVVLIKLGTLNNPATMTSQRQQIDSDSGELPAAIEHVDDFHLYSGRARLKQNRPHNHWEETKLRECQWWICMTFDITERENAIVTSRNRKRMECTSPKGCEQVTGSTWNSLVERKCFDFRGVLTFFAETSLPFVCGFVGYGIPPCCCV